MPSRIAHMVSRPDILEAAFATGPGACHSTTRCLRVSSENKSAVSVAVMAASFE
jgi:hypothetical protein